MSFSISWIGAEGVSKSDLIAALDLADTGRLDPENEAPLSAAELSTGWSVVSSHDLNYASPRRLAALSAQGRVIAVALDERVMCSSVRQYRDGAEAWSVEHDPERGVFDLRVTGAAPPELAAIHARLNGEQEAEGGETAEVDLIFDAPVELAFALCGYRHAQEAGVSVEAPFTALRSAKAAGGGGMAGFLGAIFGRR